MPAASERTPREKETLIFPTAEGAQEFSERVRGRVRKQPYQDVQAGREIMAAEVAEEFAKAGEPVDNIRHPWNHTPAEHEEVQTLVNIAFEKDLSFALKKAQQSSSYPRNLDLLHDVLTTEMYDFIMKQQFNRQPMGSWAAVMLGVVLAVLLLLVGVLMSAWQ